VSQLRVDVSLGLDETCELFDGYLYHFTEFKFVAERYALENRRTKSGKLLLLVLDVQLKVDMAEMEQMEGIGSEFDMSEARKQASFIVLFMRAATF
jgi:hypothetical protein